jgi:hypothetical protein
MTDITPNIPAHLLDLDLNKVDTSFPVVKAGIYDVIIKEIAVVDNKAADAKNLELKLSTTTQVQGVKGESFDVGHVINYRLSLKTKTDKLSEDKMVEIVYKGVAKLLQAVRPPVDGLKVRDIFDGSLEVKCKALAGRQLRIKLDALPERRDKDTQKTLAPSNDVAQFIKV